MLLGYFFNVEDYLQFFVEVVFFDFVPLTVCFELLPDLDDLVFLVIFAPPIYSNLPLVRFGNISELNFRFRLVIIAFVYLFVVIPLCTISM